MQTTKLSRKAQIHSVIAASSGNLVEWFDFYIYGFAAVYFAHNFSNATSTLFAQIEIFGVFAAGFLMLPVGSIIFGKMADIKGRKRAMIVSIIFMSFGSFGIAFLPDKQAIGDMAVVLLLLLRLIQGIAVGGEFGIVAAYLTEIAPQGKRGFVSSFQYVTIIGGQLLAVASISLLFLFIDERQMQEVLYRIILIKSLKIMLIEGALKPFLNPTKPF